MGRLLRKLTAPLGAQAGGSVQHNGTARASGGENTRVSMPEVFGIMFQLAIARL